MPRQTDFALTLSTLTSLYRKNRPGNPPPRFRLAPLIKTVPQQLGHSIALFHL